MIDIIIPVYNDYDGLAATLSSFGVVDRCNYHFIIVDDCSIADYRSLINFYSQWFKIDYLRLPVNSGPGKARQLGLDNATEPYVMFIDAGDELANSYVIANALELLHNIPTAVMFCPTHLEALEDNSFLAVHFNNNRMHGKIYKTSFLKEHKITFGPVPNCNEDIAFNMACRLIITQLSREHSDIMYIIEDDDSCVIWSCDNKNSLSRINDNSFYYKEQNYGLAMNYIHTIQIAEINNVSKDIIYEQNYSVFMSLWQFYVSTANRRPECMDEALSGALLFYKEIFKTMPMNPSMLLYYQNDILASIDWNNDPFCDKLFLFTVLDFIQLLEEKINES